MSANLTETAWESVWGTVESKGALNVNGELYEHKPPCHYTATWAPVYHIPCTLICSNMADYRVTTATRSRINGVVALTVMHNIS